MKVLRILMMMAVAAWCCVAQAQEAQGNGAADSVAVPDGEQVRVSLVTCYPGEDIYELYGHTEIRVATTTSDIIYNYGTFDFRAPNFMYRFVKGETDYMVAGYPSIYMTYGYDRRKIVEQELNLTPAQARTIADFLANNALPENRTYRYNYVLDNCSTRPRDIVEMAVGKSLQYPAMTDTTTFRKIMHRYNANYAWQQFGIDLALGSGLDYTLTYRQQMFAPIVLMKAFDGATIERDGKRVPLVASTTVIQDGSDEGRILPPTPWYAQPLTAAVLLLVIAIALSVRDIRRHKVSRWFDSILFAIYTLGGMLVFFLIFVSTHEATSPNFNGLWLNPFSIIPAVFVWIKSAEKAVIYYHFLNFAVVLLTMAFWWILPQQANAAFFPLMAVTMVRSLSYILIKYRCEIRK